MSISIMLERLSATAPDLLAVILDATVKGTAILALVWLATLAMRRSSAAARHWVWFLGVLGLLLLPILTAALPGWHVLPATLLGHFSSTQQQSSNSAVEAAPSESPLVITREVANHELPRINRTAPATANAEPPVAANTSAAASAVAGRPLSPLGWQALAVLLWFAGSATLFAYLALGHASLWWLRRRSSRVATGDWPTLIRQLSTQLGIRRPVELLCSPRRTMPMTWGLWRIRLLMPADFADWTDEQRRTVLLHELAHARRWDCLTQLIAQAACALHWFNPLAWLAWRRMQAERELACDDLVLNAGTKPSAYAEQLLQIAAEMPAARASAAIAFARPSKLEIRLRAVLDVGRNRRRVTRRGAISAALLIGAIAMLCAMVRADKPGPDAAGGPGVDLDAQNAPPAEFGRVVDAEGKPVAGAKIDTILPTWSAVTAADGLFPLHDLIARSVLKSADLRVQAAGFLNRSYGLDLRESTPVRRVIHLHRVCRLEGRLLGPDGKPLAGAPVWVKGRDVYQDEAEYYKNMNNGWCDVPAVTDRDGQFVIDNVAPGDVLMAYVPGVNFTHDPPTHVGPEPAAWLNQHIPAGPIKGIFAAQALTLKDGEARRNLVLDLSKSVGVVQGRVLDKNAKPLPGAEIHLVWNRTDGPLVVEWSDPVRTGADGRYMFNKLSMGSWMLTAHVLFPMFRWDDINAKPVRVEASDKPFTAPDLVVPVTQMPSGRIRRPQPLNDAKTIHEWIEATLAGDSATAAALVTPDSPAAGSQERLSSLLKQLFSHQHDFVPSVSSEGGKTEWADGEGTATKDVGVQAAPFSNREHHLVFHLTMKAGVWRIDDVTDEKGGSLLTDPAPAPK